RVDSVTPAPKKSDARPMAIRTRPAFAAARSSVVIAARVRPLDVVAASGMSSVIGLAPGGAKRGGLWVGGWWRTGKMTDALWAQWVPCSGSVAPAARQSIPTPKAGG